MSEPHLLAFVDSIASSPTVRLDLSGGTRGPFNLRDGSRFDPPALKRSVPDSLLADGGAPTAAAYENRVIILQLQLQTNGGLMAPDAAAGQIQLLTRELDRPTNFLRYQAGTATPVFFRTFRGGPEAVDFNPVNRELTVSVLAEPFAYGLKETVSSTVVTNNPASSMFLDITNPKGDIETPLTLEIEGTNGVSGRLNPAIAVRRRGTPSAAPFLLQAEAMTQGTNTTTQVNSASFSGSGNNYSRCTFGTATMVTRLSTTKFPSSASVDARGTYRVFARVKLNTGTDLVNMRLIWGQNTTNFVTNNSYRLPADTNIKWVNLDLVQIPAGYDPVTDGLSGVELSTEGVFLAVQAERLSGSGTLDIDALILLPADDRLMYVRLPDTQNNGSDVFIIEGGPRPSVYCTTAAGVVTTTQLMEVTGTGPMITPGRTNRVYYCRDVGSTASGGDSLTATTTVTPVYYPRYLSPVRPAAS